MRRISKIVALLMCFALAVMMMGCSGKSGDNEPSGGGSEPAPPETHLVRLALFPHGHVLNVIAEKEGYLEDEGLAVQYVRVDNDLEVFEMMERGEIDIASNQGTNLPLQRISEGQDLTIFGGYLLTGCMPIFAKVDTEWNGINDLIGKTMACESNVYAITGPLLDKGFDPIRDVTWTPYETQEERIKAVKEGKADYGLVGTQLNYAINNDPDLKVCTYASDVLADYSCCRIEARTEWVQQNPNTVKALLRAWIRALAYYDNHHDEAVALMIEATGQDEEYLRAYMDNPHCNINTDPMRSSVKRAWNYMNRLGLLDDQAKLINIDDHINVELYKEALDECQNKYGNENPKFYEKMQEQFSKNDL